MAQLAHSTLKQSKSEKDNNPENNLIESDDKMLISYYHTVSSMNFIK